MSNQATTNIWQKQATVEQLNQRSQNTLASHIDIQVTEIGADYLVCSMPVNANTHQPMGILHGGASVVLAESVGSVAANMAVDYDHYCVGLEINANHVRSIRQGLVFGRAEPLHLGRQTHVWAIRIEDEQQRLICTSRLTMAVLKNKT